MSVSHVRVSLKSQGAYVGARIEAFRTVAGMEEEGSVFLHLGELVP